MPYNLKANIVTLTKQNDSGESIIHTALFKRDALLLAEILQEVQKANVNFFQVNAYDQTIYHFLAYIKDPKILELVLKLSPPTQIEFLRDSYGRTPLENAISCDNDLFLNHYLKTFKQSTLDYRFSNTQKNILHLIAEENAFKCNEILLAHLERIEYENLFRTKDLKHVTPYEIAKDKMNTIYERHQNYIGENGFPTLQAFSLKQFLKPLDEVLQTLSDEQVKGLSNDPSAGLPLGDNLHHTKPWITDFALYMTKKENKRREEELVVDQADDPYASLMYGV